MHDCCGYCPKPVTEEDKEVAEEESKIYISGDVSFIKDDPGRQEIGSFNPITDTDWTGDFLMKFPATSTTMLIYRRNGVHWKHGAVVSSDRRSRPRGCEGMAVTRLSRPEHP